MIALVALALAGDPLVEADLGGHVKSFYVATFPYDSPLFPGDPTGVGIIDGRLNLDVDIGDALSVEAHHALTFLPGEGAMTTGLSSGVAPSAPEAIPLTWVAVDNPSLRVQGRMDRLNVKLSVPSVDVVVGRQPVSFGSGNFFTPMDLVNPFTPTVIDQEYKPGVDAARVDVYAGMSGQITAVAAYAGDWDADGIVVAGFGKGTVGITDIGGFAGWVRGDLVVGASVVSSVGVVGLHGDLTVTKPDGDAFVRGVVGADWQPFENTTLSGEVYVQTLGQSDPADFLLFGLDPRSASGELWLLGRVYAGAAWMQQITPLVTGSLAVIGNLEDPSAFIAPGLDWSVADDVVVTAGGFIGVGQRPNGLALRSEFGTYPVVGYLQLRTYF